MPTVIIPWPDPAWPAAGEPWSVELMKARIVALERIVHQLCHALDRVALAQPSPPPEEKTE